MERSYIAIDLKSFYASVECIQRGLDPMLTNLVVADATRTEKTICLAVTPALKQYGVPGRARLFEVVQKIDQINAIRRLESPAGKLLGASCHDTQLRNDPTLAVDYLIAPPRMALYMQISGEIYGVYLRYVAPEDIHIYSIDEVFIDATAYLSTYGITARELAEKMMFDVWKATGITATAGIGPNLFLCKVAMDIVAKHNHSNEHGTRVAELDEQSYRQLLWNHRPLTDFWRVGRGYAKKLERHGMYTMGDVARCSLHNEQLLYRLFGVNAQLLIDHAWGYEGCTIADIKAYRPASNSLGSGQVLSEAYPFQKARLVMMEMVDALALDLLDKGLVTDQLVMTVGYDIENVTNGSYRGEVTTDPYGRKIPKHAHGTGNTGKYTSSAKALSAVAGKLFDRIVDSALLVRRLNIVAAHVIREGDVPPRMECDQMDLFSDPEDNAEEKALARERSRQKAVLAIRKKYGKNAILKGMNFEEGATARERNRQIGGHKA